jgi:hypothetical protein
MTAGCTTVGSRKSLEKPFLHCIDENFPIGLLNRVQLDKIFRQSLVDPAEKKPWGKRVQGSTELLSQEKKNIVCEEA